MVPSGIEQKKQIESFHWSCKQPSFRYSLWFRFHSALSTTYLL